ncbi:MAG TPA: hypothetical protein P5116_04215 [Eubacteriales bacterium]|nr:hypothetical protein [Eubacteriales bacterium]
MKQFFEELEKLGRSAVVELRQIDARQAPMFKDYLEQRMKGDITEQGYQGLVKSLEEARKKVVDKYKADMEALAARHAEAVDALVYPSAERMVPGDIEILKNFNLSKEEFEAMADKYADNPTMGRLLEDYRTQHKVATNWRFQTGHDRKQVFQSACSSVESIMGQLDKYVPDREGNVTRRVFGCYHELQGSDPDALPVPAEEAGSTTVMIGNAVSVPGSDTGRMVF